MKRALALALIAVGFGGAAVSQWASIAHAQGPHAVVVEIDEAIQPYTARFLARAVETATEDGARFVVIRLDTPGGLFDATRDIVETILEAEIPVIVYVSPSGAQAASAGTFIAAAGHVAAMSSGTNIGAASPVDSEGGDLPQTLQSKVMNDAAAFLRSIAVERGRNVEALQDAVIRVKAYSASEALENNVIDLVAKDLDELLTTLDGTSVELLSGPYVIETRDIELQEIDRNILERFLAVISNPDVAFLLLVMGAIGVFIEFVSPGLLGPGILGVVCLALAFVAFGNLPVNWTGLALLGLALVLMFAEVQAPGISIFGISGVISFVFGAVLLFGGFSPEPIDGPNVRVNYWLIGVVTAFLSAFLLFIVRDILTAQKIASKRLAKGITTALSLSGSTGVVSTELAPAGMVHVAGEEWSALSDTGEQIEVGSEVIVSEADGLTLRVFRATQ